MGPPARSRVVLLGCGGVGRALAELLVGSSPAAGSLSLVAVADSGSLVSSPGGGALSADAVRHLLVAKAGGGSLAQAAASAPSLLVVAAAPPPAALPPLLGDLVADCTAGDTLALLLRARADGYSVALANKRPLCGPLHASDTLRGRLRLRCCATVGAGLPVHAVVARLTAAGDSAASLTGALSGTLGFVLGRVQDGAPFSAAVAEARVAGLTEPDPRDDLGGDDVARKALILARALGWRLEAADVPVESLYPAEMGAAAMGVAAFMGALPRLDAAFADRARAAAAQGGVLRYVATLTADGSAAGGRARVGLAAVARDSPLGRLRGCDSLVELASSLGVYTAAAPLVVSGRGAGALATACGVLADLLELHELRGGGAGEAGDA